MCNEEENSMGEVVECIIEYNENGYLIYAENYPGAYARGSTKEEALKKNS